MSVDHLLSLSNKSHALVVFLARCARRVGILKNKIAALGAPGMLEPFGRLGFPRSTDVLGKLEKVFPRSTDVLEKVFVFSLPFPFLSSSGILGGSSGIGPFSHSGDVLAHEPWKSSTQERWVGGDGAR